MLSPRDAFKVGFLARCAHDGLGAEQIAERVKIACALMEKTAILGALANLGGKALDVGRWGADMTMGVGLPVAVAAPWVVGGLAGYGAARATDIDDTGVKDIQDRELVDTYRRARNQLLRSRVIRDYNKARQRTGRTFT